MSVTLWGQKAKTMLKFAEEDIVFTFSDLKMESWNFLQFQWEHIF